MWRIYGGAIAFIAGVSAFIVDYRNRPQRILGEVSEGHASLVSGLTPTAYDLLHVAGWALIVVGVLLMIMGLIRYSAAIRSR
jgi:hypothetical protein